MFESIVKRLLFTVKLSPDFESFAGNSSLESTLAQMRSYFTNRLQTLSKQPPMNSLSSFKSSQFPIDLSLFFGIFKN